MYKVIRLIAVKVKLIVYKIELTAVILQLENTDILFSPSHIDIDMVNIFHLVLIFLRYTVVQR